MNILILLDELQAIARNGLHYTSDNYDRDRYERLMGLATQAYSELLQAPSTEIKARLLKEIGQVTPKVGADAAIFDASGNILLMERSDNSGWCMPSGWVEQNEKPVDAVIREVREETGLRVKVEYLVGVFTREPSMSNGPHAMISILHLCEIIGGELQLSNEGSALRYWPIEAVKDWHADHYQLAIAAYETWKSRCLLPSISD